MNIKQNMGTADRVIRFLVAAVILVLYATGILQGSTAVLLLIASAVFILTGMVSFCPLYLPFHITTKRKNQ
jgi:hypothetical protein